MSLNVPWVATCRDCGRDVEAFAPVMDGSDGHYIRCGNCGHISHTTKRLGPDEADLSRGPA